MLPQKLWQHLYFLKYIFNIHNDDEYLLYKSSANNRGKLAQKESEKTLAFRFKNQLIGTISE